MSSDTATDTDVTGDVTGDEPLDDQQRIERLEKAGKLNRILIFALAGVLLLTLLAWLLIALLGSTPEEDEPAASQASVQALQQELGALQLQVGTLQQQLQEQQKLIVMVQQQKPKPASVAPTAEASPNDRETVSMVAKTLIGQEHNYQESLSALKVGMRDLARMIAGSRSWLAFYEESLAKPMADSQARVKALQAWEAKQTK